jgi:hypothetical protein
MNNFVYILLIAANGWAMVDSLSRGQNIMACVNAFVLGLLTLRVLLSRILFITVK